MKRIFLLRHGRTGFSRKYIGSSDVPLSKEGEEQIVDLKKKPFFPHVESTLCSPLLRCRRSYELLNLDTQVQFDDNLREVDFGRWEKMDFDEIASQDPDLVDQWAASPESFTFPEGESLVHFVTRVKKVHRDISQRDCDNLLVISHGGVIRLLLCLLLSIPLEKYLLFHVEKGALSTVELYDEGAVLKELNCK